MVINYIEIKSESNYSDSLSKQIERKIFNEHCDTFMGRKKPAYAALKSIMPHVDALSTTSNIIHYISGSTSNNQVSNE